MNLNWHFFDGLNEYYVHDQHLDLCDSFSIPISIFDQIKTLDYVLPHYILGENLDRFLDRSPHFTQALYEYYGKLELGESFLVDSKIENVRDANSVISNHGSDLKPWNLEQILAHRESQVFKEFYKLADANHELEEAIATHIAELQEVVSSLSLLKESRIFRSTEPLRRIYFLALKLKRDLRNPSNGRIRFFNWALKQILIKMQLNPRLRLVIFSILPASISTKLRIYVKNQLYIEVPHQEYADGLKLSHVLLSANKSSLNKNLYDIWNE